MTHNLMNVYQVRSVIDILKPLHALFNEMHVIHERVVTLIFLDCSETSLEGLEDVRGWIQKLRRDLMQRNECLVERQESGKMSAIRCFGKNCLP